MATVTELRKMAHDLYASARASRNPFTKQKFRKSADDHLEEAEHLRRTQRPSLRVIDGSKGDKISLRIRRSGTMHAVDHVIQPRQCGHRLVHCSILNR
jgi:hypothetical protein